jgi:hypothetical protein
LSSFSVVPVFDVIGALFQAIYTSNYLCMVLNFSRRTIVISVVTLATLLFLIFALPMLSPQYGAERTVNKLMDAFEVNDMESIGAIIDANYADPWKFTHDEIVDFAKVFRRHITTCTVSRSLESAVLTEDEQSATIVHTVRLFGKGHGIADYMLQGSSAVPTKITFTLRRNSGKPWDWKVTKIETPYSDKARGYKGRLEKMSAQLESYLQ